MVKVTARRENWDMVKMTAYLVRIISSYSLLKNVGALRLI